MAHQGTLFLDEIATLTLPLQSKLLRVLEDRSLTRLGGKKPIKVDFRLVSATNENLEEMMKEGRFREDLDHRIHVEPILCLNSVRRVCNSAYFVRSAETAAAVSAFSEASAGRSASPRARCRSARASRMVAPFHARRPPEWIGRRRSSADSALCRALPRAVSVPDQTSARSGDLDFCLAQARAPAVVLGGPYPGQCLVRATRSRTG